MWSCSQVLNYKSSSALGMAIRSGQFTTVPQDTALTPLSPVPEPATMLHGRAGRLNLSKPAEIDAQSLAELLDGHPRQAAYPGRF